MAGPFEPSRVELTGEKVTLSDLVSPPAHGELVCYNPRAWLDESSRRFVAR